MHVMVSMHSTDTFHQKDMRKDIYLQCHPEEYYIDYQVLVEKEDRRGQKTCRNYNFDQECVYRRFEEDIPKATSDQCTVPWTTEEAANICDKPEDLKLAKSMTGNITNIIIQNCTNVCVSMPLVFTGGHNARNPEPPLTLTMRFQPWITTSTEENLYSIWSLGAETGGYVGIMVGCSLLSMADYFLAVFKK